MQCLLYYGKKLVALASNNILSLDYQTKAAETIMYLIGPYTCSLFNKKRAKL